MKPLLKLWVYVHAMEEDAKAQQQAAERQLVMSRISAVLRGGGR